VNKISQFISSVFYIGYFPFASGTFASFIALILWWYIPNNNVQIIIIITTILLGTYFSNLIEKKLNLKDPSFIVIDEFAGMFISLMLIPKDISLYILGFILFRFFDIFKPFYIDTVQKYRYGIGVMADDILAGIVTLFIINLYMLFIF
tara:strand:+ start:4041 stop:4484 length:444 start_codon:yes stop_codon:yes gene_type:complete